MTGIQFNTPNLIGCVQANIAHHNGTFCGCEACRSKLIAAFASDLALHFKDQGNAQILNSIARCAFQAWTFNGQSVEQLITAMGLMQFPNSEHVNVKVEITPYSEEQRELLNAKPAGSA